MWCRVQPPLVTLHSQEKTQRRKEAERREETTGGEETQTREENQRQIDSKADCCKPMDTFSILHTEANKFPKNVWDHFLCIRRQI